MHTHIHMQAHHIHVVLVKVSIAVKRHHDHSSSYTEKRLTEGFSFGGSVHYDHDESMAVGRQTWC